ncbi:hypothetical protein PR202_gb06616 [Eleusine coracana subsp. coracana]|uniref:Uncharacterized protein n=1 Tax=Eleusine coracana subsp. coracana TaxID=191504 RepID=A0AAV5E7K2_ELECO|nr:hypothetical protein PR202_gb06616 [Eleusine coracana subsp. coracana]
MIKPTRRQPGVGLRATRFGKHHSARARIRATWRSGRKKDQLEVRRRRSPWSLGLSPSFPSMSAGFRWPNPNGIGSTTSIPT